MPELPEVEGIRRVLGERTTSMRLTRVQVRRVDVIKPIKGRRTAVRASQRKRSLLENGRITSVLRHGKRLALEADDGRVLEFGLGMSGHLEYSEEIEGRSEQPHEHLRWRLEDSGGRARGMLVWRDPRRFGGVTPLPSLDALRKRQWGHLGPDALEVEDHEFIARLKVGSAAIKTRLLDQTVLAGVGNIYADEALFRAGINPIRKASRISTARLGALHGAVRSVLSEAIRAGGSSIRTFRDPEGRMGGFQESHAVYGRQGECCDRCRTLVRGRTVGGRTTAWCPGCQQ